ncbi:MAG: hypothetical protein K2Q20_11800, partial [Phycisphaerales bacterium]|nr:hypothetical protein [Phycisphaerales bacterium]
AAADDATQAVLEGREDPPLVRNTLMQKYSFMRSFLATAKKRQAERAAGSDIAPSAPERKQRPVPGPELAPGEITRANVPGRAVALALSPDGKSAFCGSTHTPDSVHRWHLDTGDRLATYDDPTAEFHAMALDITPRGNLLVAGGADYDRDAVAKAAKDGAEDPYTERARGSCDLRVWEAASTKLERRIEGSGDPIVSVAISPDGRLVAAGTTAGEARVWSLADGKPVKTLKVSPTGGVVNGVRFSPNGERLAVGVNREESSVTIFETHTWSKVSDASSALSIGAAAFSRNGSMLAHTRIGAVVLTPTDGKPPVELLCLSSAARKSRPNSVSFSPDGRRLLSAEGMDSSYAAMFLLVGDPAPRIRIFDVPDRRPIAELVGHVDAVGAAHFTPDGSRIVSCGTDGTLRVWKSPPSTAEPPAAKSPTAP